MAEKITTREENYSQWYLDIILKATIRVLPFNKELEGTEKCIYYGKEAEYQAVFAKAY